MEQLYPLCHYSDHQFASLLCRNQQEEGSPGEVKKQESPDLPPAACGMGEMQAGGHSRGTRAKSVTSNKRATSRGRGGS